jgi:hypothetical protein
MTKHDVDDEETLPVPSKKEKTMALAIHDKKLYRGATPQQLFDCLPKGAKILPTPADLFTSAWPNTIYAFVEKQIGNLPLSLRQMNNNPGYWFEVLGKMAQKVELHVKQKSVKKDFTFNAKQPITETLTPEEEMAKSRSKKAAASTDKKRKHLDKSLKLKLLIDENPRRKGTAGFKSWEKMENGMSVAEFLQKGGRMVDLQWDVKKGHVSLS